MTITLDLIVLGPEICLSISMEIYGIMNQNESFRQTKMQVNPQRKSPQKWHKIIQGFEAGCVSVSFDWEISPFKPCLGSEKSTIPTPVKSTVLDMGLADSFSSSTPISGGTVP
jgi:hypothetical protein